MTTETARRTEHAAWDAYEAAKAAAFGQPVDHPARADALEKARAWDAAHDALQALIGLDEPQDYV